MNYKKVYDGIIGNANFQNRIKYVGEYYERHHIIPKCMGGKDNKDNIVLLTAKEHFICHKLLVEIYPKNKNLIYALNNMMFRKNQYRNYRISSGEYERFKILFAKEVSNRLLGHVVSEETREKISKANKGKIRSEQAKQNMRNSIKDVSGEKNPMWGRIGENNPNYGRKQSESCKVKCSEANKGKILSDETKKKISDSHKLRETHKCVYCGFETKIKTNIIRYHNDNCKENPNRKREIIKCPHCDVTSINKANMTRYHFTNCKYYKNEE